MRKPLRNAYLSPALGVIALLAGALQAQAAITFPANQQPFNLLVDDSATVVNVCVFFSDHKKKKDFRAVVDWGDGSADTTNITPAKNGRNRFIVRSTHDYNACGVFPITCDISYQNGLETGQDTNEATVSVSNVAPVITMAPSLVARRPATR